MEPSLEIEDQAWVIVNAAPVVKVERDDVTDLWEVDLTSILNQTIGVHADSEEQARSLVHGNVVQALLEA